MKKLTAVIGIVFAAVILCAVALYAAKPKSGEALIKECMEMTDSFNYPGLLDTASIYFINHKL